MQIVKLEGNSNASVITVPDLEPGPGQVVVQTAGSALCGSELHGYRDDGMETGNSGHEAAGVVAAIGEGVTTLQEGQRVGVSAVVGCGNCDRCAKGQLTWCANHTVQTGMHAEQFLSAARACHPLPDDVSWDAGVLLSGDGLGVPYHTSRKLLAEDIESVAIFGAGPIGLGNTLVQSWLGRRVIAVDVLANRLETATALGAAEVVNASEGDAVEQIRELTGGVGADACIEAAGRPDTALACFSAVRIAGTVVFNGEQGELPLSPSTHFIRRDVTAVGSWFYHFSEFAAMLALYRDGMRVADLISDQIPYSDAPEAFRMFATGESKAKVMLTYA